MLFRSLTEKIRKYFIIGYYIFRHPRRFYNALSRRGKRWALRGLISLLIILIAVPFSFWYQAKRAKAGWWNEDWMYRQKIQLSNSTGSTLSDFQVAVTVDTASLITAHKMQATTCADLRFTDSTGKILPHWIEENNPGCNNAATKVWIKAPSVYAGTNATNIYMYYGNPSAGSIQDGNQVFEFFDDFSGSSVNTNKWAWDSNRVSPSIVSDSGTSAMRLIPQSSNEGPIVGRTSAMTDIVFQTRMRDTYNAYYHIGRHSGLTTPVGDTGDGFFIYSTHINLYRNNAGYGSWSSVTNVSRSLTISSYHTYTMAVHGSTWDLYEDGAGSPTDTGTDATYSSGYPTLLAYSGNDMLVDYFWARKYASASPTSSASSEEKSPAPIVHWKMDEGFGTSTQDSTVYNQDQTFSGTPTWETDDKCVTGKCLNFDTDDSDYSTYTVSSTSPMNLGTSDFTVSHWQKVFQPATAGSGLIGRYPHNTDYNGNWSTGISDNRTTYFFMHRNNAGTLEQYGIDYSDYFGKWAHVAWTKSGSTLSLYIDGKFKQQWTAGITYNIDFSGDPFFLGQTGWSPGTMSNLTLDDLKIYQYARTANQVKQDYNAGLSGTGSSAGSNVSVGESPKWMTEGLAGYWKMDESSGNAVDSSGNGNTGTVTGSPTQVSGKAGWSKNLANTAGGTATDYFHNASMTGLSTEGQTVSVWINPDVITSAERQCFVQTPGSFFDIEANGNLTAYFQTNPSGWVAVGSSGLQAGVWQHVVQTYDRNEHRLYINGELKSSSSARKEPLYNSGAVRLGDASWANEAFDGKMQEARIYSRALSADEVKQLSEWTPGPVAYYNFDEKTGSTVYDRSGHNLNLSMAGSPTFTGGKYNGALKFDKNTTDSVYLQNSAFKLNDYTYGFWYKMDSTQDGNWYQIMEIYGTTDREPAVWHHYTSNCFHARENPSNEGFDCAGPNGVSTYWTAGQWYYYSQTKSGTSLKYYINGVEKGSMTVTDPMASSANPTFYLGKGESNSAGFTIDDFRLYNYARTPKQIEEDMNAGHPVGGSPLGSQVAYWKMDEGYGGTAYDDIKNQNGTLTNGTSGSIPTFTNSGKFGKALGFSRTNKSYVNISGSTAIIPSSITISGWFRRTESGYEHSIIGDWWDRWGQISINTSNKLVWQWLESDGSTWHTLTSNADVSLNTWTYFSATFDKSSKTGKLYINGNAEDTETGANDMERGSNGYVSIGASGESEGNNPDWFTGQIDELKIYNSALTSEQVKLDMNQGKALQLGGGQTSATGATGQASQYCVPGDTTSCSAPVAEWKLDEKTGTDAYDTSGNGNTGTLGTGGSQPQWTTGKIGSALQFDGGDHVAAADSTSLGFTTGFTVEAWVYPTSWTSSGNHNTIVGKENEFLLAVNNSGNLANYISAGGSWAMDGNQPAIPLNTWTHLTLTYNGSKIYSYVDGKVQGTGTSKTGNMDDTSYVLAIGKRDNGSYQPFAGGKIDDVRIYNYARTPAQVAWDFNRGGPVGWWKFDEGEDVTAHDFSGNNNTGTMTSMDPPNDWVTGKFEKALDFDGSDDYVAAGTALTDTMESAGSISMWVYPDALGGLFSRSLGGSWTDERCVLNFYSTGGALDLTLSNGTSYWRHLSNSVVPTGTWTHLVVTWDGTNVKHYFNGKLDRSQAQGGVPEMTGVKTWLGKTEGLSPNLFDGKMDDVQVYNYALTAEQVKQVMNNNMAIRFGE